MIKTPKYKGKKDTKKAEKNYFHVIFSCQGPKSLTMSNSRSQDKIDKIVFTFIQADIESQAPLFEEINKELEAFLSKENNNADSTDAIFDFLSQKSDSIQEEFEELLNGDSKKNKFVKAMLKIFTLLLNTNVDTTEKNKKNHQNCHRNNA